MKILDTVLVIAGIVVGIYSLLKPREAWKLFQSKKIRDQEPTQQAIKLTRIFAGVLLAVTVGLMIIMYIYRRGV